MKAVLEMESIKVSELDSLKELIAALQEKCAFLEKVIHEVPANIYVSDLEKGDIVWCNKTNEETLGYSQEEMLEMGGMEYFRRIVHPEDQNIPEESMTHYRSFNGAEYGGIFRAKHKEGHEYKWFIGWAKAFEQQEDGTVQKLVCVDVDMSPRVNTEKQLVAALQENLKLKNKLLLQSLHKRELEIVGLICQGLSSKDIAAKLFISIHTVNTHRKNIQAKLGTANVADLVSLAREAGLG